MKNYVIALLATAAVAAFASTAQAGVIFHDDFTSNGQVPADNWTGDVFFTPQPQPPTSGAPSVDLVGTGNFASLAPNAGNTTPATVSLIGLNAVDLDGSTGYGNSPAGVLVSNVSFAPGNYTVTFALAGNLRGNVAQTTLFGFETNAPGVITAPSSQPYTWYSETFFDASGPLIFEDLGPSDQQGNLLADVTIVPEASTWAMMMLGFAGLGFAAYRRARPVVSIA
jgi:hypothetical protein